MTFPEFLSDCLNEGRESLRRVLDEKKAIVGCLGMFLLQTYDGL
jgi:hypothetical protein